MDVAELGYRVDSDDLERGTRALKKHEQQSARTERGVTKLDRSFAGMAATMARGAALIGSALAAAFSTRAIFQFQDAVAEVSTLVDTTTFSMRELEAAAIAQAQAFGGGAAQQAKSFYQIISAGASTAAEATETLTAANKLAVGGVTSVAQAADGLTSVLNAYGDRVESAAAVSDAMFVAMRAGKTTIGELSASLGRVAPLAAQTGVSFDELLAAVSALTKGGISTAESMTGVRAILAAVAKPSSEASKLAEALGIEFNSAGLEARGLAGFLEDLVARTGGSTDALAVLFGGVEALVPAMALSGQAGEDFADILDQMGDKAGQTELAFSKMANSPGFQMDRVFSAISAEAISLGGVLGESLVPVMALIADNADLVVAGLVGVATALGTYAAAAGIAATASTGLAAAIALVGGPIGLIAVAVGGLAAGYILLRDNTNQATVSQINYLQVSAGLSEITQTLTTSSVQMSSALMEETNQKYSAATAALELAKANREATLSTLQYLQAHGQMASALNELSGNISAGQIADQRRREIEEYKKDLATIDGVISDIQRKRTALGYAQYGNARNGGSPDVAGIGSGTTVTLPSVDVSSLLGRGGGGGSGGGGKSFADIVADAEAYIRTLEAQQQALGQVGAAALQTRYAQELLNEAQSAGIDLTPQQTATLQGLASQMAQVEHTTNMTKEALDFAKGATKGFLQTMRQGLMQGKSVWESFGNAALGVLDKIIGKLEDQLVDAIFSANSSFSTLGSGIGGGGGGFFGGILGGIGRLLGFDGGGYTGNGGKHQPAGTVHKGEFVFSQEAVRAIGVKNLNAMHKSARRGFASGGYVGGHDNYATANSNARTQTAYAPVYHIDARGADQGAVRRIENALKEFDKNFGRRTMATIDTVNRRNVRPL